MESGRNIGLKESGRRDRRTGSGTRRKDIYVYYDVTDRTIIDDILFDVDFSRPTMKAATVDFTYFWFICRMWDDPHTFTRAGDLVYHTVGKHVQYPDDAIHNQYYASNGSDLRLADADENHRHGDESHRSRKQRRVLSEEDKEAAESVRTKADEKAKKQETADKAKKREALDKAKKREAAEAAKEAADSPTPPSFSLITDTFPVRRPSPPLTDGTSTHSFPLTSPVGVRKSWKSYNIMIRPIYNFHRAEYFSQYHLRPWWLPIYWPFSSSHLLIACHS